MAVSDDGSVIAAGGSGGETTVWDGGAGTRLNVNRGAAAVLAVAVSPSGALVAAGTRELDLAYARQQRVDRYPTQQLRERCGEA